MLDFIKGLERLIFQSYKYLNFYWFKPLSVYDRIKFRLYGDE